MSRRPKPDAVEKLFIFHLCKIVGPFSGRPAIALTGTRILGKVPETRRLFVPPVRRAPAAAGIVGRPPVTPPAGTRRETGPPLDPPPRSS